MQPAAGQARRARLAQKRAAAAGAGGPRAAAGPPVWRAHLLCDGVGLHAGAAHLAGDAHGALILLSAVAGSNERVEHVHGGGQACSRRGQHRGVGAPGLQSSARGRPVRLACLALHF